MLPSSDSVWASPSPSPTGRSREIEDIVYSLASLGLRLHGFGVKVRGLARHAGYLASAGSLAWSFDAWRSAPLPGCRHASCANCLRYAAGWRGRVLRRLGAVLLRLEPVA